MYILGIETSCDETSAAIVRKKDNKLILKSNIISSSLSLHSKTGGIIPENAAREQIKFIIPVIKKALKKATIKIEDIDALAVTYGPGLIGSLLVGVETIKTIAFVLDKPIIPVNHMIGHIYANFINDNPKLNPKPYTLNPEMEFPALALVVSGGHTDLLLLKNHGDFRLIGGTRDDAAGEAYDKIARLLGFPYPGGPAIEHAAANGNSKRFRFPRPLIGSMDFDFSFSGLKTAVLREVISIKQETSSRHSGLSRISNVSDSGVVVPPPQNDALLDTQTINDIAFATQDAIIDVLIKKTLKAAKEYNAKSILLSGGVAANQSLRDQFKVLSSQFSVKLFAPAKSLCTDNAAMIAAAAFYNYNPVPWKNITANPELYFT